MEESQAITRLLHEARLPQTKTLDGFEFDRSGVSAGAIAHTSRGRICDQGGPVLLIGGGRFC